MKFSLLFLCFFSVLAQAEDTFQYKRVAFYPLDGHANDASGYDKHGVISGASLTSDRFAQQSGAYLFDGKDDYVRITSTLQQDADTIFFGNADFALSIWVKQAENQQVGVLMGGLAMNRFTLCCAVLVGYALHVDSNDELYLTLMNGGYAYTGGGCAASACIRYPLNASLTDNKWHHLVINVDKANAVGAFYFDGELRANFDPSHYQEAVEYYGFFMKSATQTLGYGSVPVTLDALNQNILQTAFWHGALDEAQSFARQLSATEIQTLASHDTRLPVVWRNQSSTLNAEFKLHIPYLQFMTADGNLPLSADLTWLPDAQGRLLFEVEKYQALE
jgi:hypothetical protein